MRRSIQETSLFSSLWFRNYRNTLKPLFRSLLPSVRHLCPPTQVEQQVLRQSLQFRFFSYNAHRLLFYQLNIELRTLVCQVNWWQSSGSHFLNEGIHQKYKWISCCLLCLNQFIPVQPHKLFKSVLRPQMALPQYPLSFLHYQLCQSNWLLCHQSVSLFSLIRKFYLKVDDPKQHRS
jgi:hypothetical protein